ncbi:putative integral membrane protein (plasmid) [Phocaeicola salanitronis DSM 18170]|uniref:Putative integral membrane protein n=1 Tax=Phocaeicola salanitronis (strain DSM 18170 / JCM 13657 / CCUG 60908 / BL78) TaxID=667015 RepID=F0R949_PHOSB|nr:hypothetical protein [Phocaeicola salanitronis]ADY38170.1 putative integral membrane protein [Phocaeicola salanitronis DSM 18170]
MDYSKFILTVFGIYILYYAINIVYDSFFHKSSQEGNINEDEEFIIDEEEDEEKPHEVLDNEVEQASLQEEIKDDSGEHNDEIQIVMEVETQGIPLEELIAKGKNMFATVNY